MSILSCSGDTTNGPSAHDPSRTYWALQLNQHALNLARVAPYDTFRLAATAVTVTGTPLKNFGRFVYKPADSTVTVDSAGLVTAHYATASGFTQIVVSLQSEAQNVTHADTVFVQVTDTVPHSRLATLSIHPAPGDSAKRSADFNDDGTFSANGAGGRFTWAATATTVGGDTVCRASTCPLQLYYRSSNPLVGTIDRTTGTVAANDTGHVIFTATTWAYGVAVSDSVDFTVGYRLTYSINLLFSLVLGVLTLGFAAPKKLILGVGAVVTFCNQDSKHQANIVFDKPELVDSASAKIEIPGTGTFVYPPTGGGNIAPFTCDSAGDSTCTVDQATGGNGARSRRFPVAGVYRYHSTLFPSDNYEIVIQQQK